MDVNTIVYCESKLRSIISDELKDDHKCDWAVTRVRIFCFSFAICKSDFSRVNPGITVRKQETNSDQSGDIPKCHWWKKREPISTLRVRRRICHGWWWWNGWDGSISWMDRLTTTSTCITYGSPEVGSRRSGLRTEIVSSMTTIITRVMMSLYLFPQQLEGPYRYRANSGILDYDVK